MAAALFLLVLSALICLFLAVTNETKQPLRIAILILCVALLLLGQKLLQQLLLITS